MMYEITLKYQDWFYASRMSRSDLFTALGMVLDSHEHRAVQWYRVRPLASEEGAPSPPEKAEATDLAVRILSMTSAPALSGRSGGSPEKLRVNR